MTEHNKPEDDDWAHGVFWFPKYGGVVKFIRGRRPDDATPIKAEVAPYPLISEDETP
jgi:hypothetical protein